MCYKLPKILDLPETERSFRFVWFEEFPWACYSQWENGAYCFACVLLGHKIVGSSSPGNLYKKTISDMANSSKNAQKTSKCFNGDTQKDLNFTY